MHSAVLPASAQRALPAVVHAVVLRAAPLDAVVLAVPAAADAPAVPATAPAGVAL